jgi:hypothetical protein
MTPRHASWHVGAQSSGRKATTVTPTASIPLPDPTGRGRTAAHEARHLLILPADVDAEEVETLAVSRFASARWELLPEGVQPVLPVRKAAPDAPGVLRISRHSTVTGPYAPLASFGPDAAMVFDVVCPRERGSSPLVGGGDRDGIARAFPAGVPMRAEERTVTWLVAAARRLGGSLRLDVGNPDADGGAGILVQPDPEAAVDLCVYSDVWLEPNAALALVLRVHPKTTLATQGTSWQGPPQGISEMPLYRGEKLSAERRHQLHAAAEEYDIAALSGGSVLDGYGLLVDLGADGLIAVEIGGEEHLPLLLRDLPWTTEGAVAYRVRWEPPDLEDSQQEKPSTVHVMARGRVVGVIAQITRALYKAVGGEVADEAEFLLDPQDL